MAQKRSIGIYQCRSENTIVRKSAQEIQRGKEWEENNVKQEHRRMVPELYVLGFSRMITSEPR